MMQELERAFGPREYPRSGIRAGDTLANRNSKDGFLSESRSSRRGLRAGLARRIGRFLGVSDLFTSVQALQSQLEAEAQERSVLRARILQLAERLDQSFAGLSAWTTTTYLGHVSVPDHALISVVLPTHNRADLVQRAVLSVIAQSYSNWELLVVDDASDDDTPKVLSNFTDSRIRVLRREQQGGASASRNTGLAAARGEFVVYLDDDNMMHPHWLKGVAWAFDLHPEALVMIGARIIDDELRNQGLGRGGWPQLAPPGFDRDAIARESVADLMQVAHRRELPGAHFDEQIRVVEDWDLLARLTRERDPLLFPAVSGIYMTSASDRFMDTGLLEQESRRVREKIAAMKAEATPTTRR
jgi:Glycosyl transferase family 2